MTKFDEFYKTLSLLVASDNDLLLCTAYFFPSQPIAIVTFVRIATIHLKLLNGYANEVPLAERLLSVTRSDRFPNSSILHPKLKAPRRIPRLSTPLRISDVTHMRHHDNQSTGDSRGSVSSPLPSRIEVSSASECLGKGGRRR